MCEKRYNQRNNKQRNYMIFNKSSHQLPIELTMPTICIFIAYRLDYYKKSLEDATELYCLFGDDREK